jgi:hypothetical protein
MLIGINSIFPMSHRGPSEQNEHFARFVSEHGPDWNAIQQPMNGRSNRPIAARRKAVPDPDLIKGSFLPEEDDLITKFAQELPQRPWSQIATIVPHRTAKQCRERWLVHLDPSVKKDPWSDEEDVIIFQLFQRIGAKWAEIARSLPGRSDNSVKNRFNSSISNRMKTDEMGKPFLVPSAARRYRQKTQKRQPSRAALARQSLWSVQPPANVNENPILGPDFEFGASDQDESQTGEPEDFPLANPETW